MAEGVYKPLVAARNMPATIDMARNGSGGFDVDAYHAMDARDDQLIADEILNGAGSSKFVYQFNLAGTNVTGVSVVGARQLAYHYGGIKHRLIASVQKTGSLFQFTSFPQDGMPMNVQASTMRELESEPDFYGVIIEVTDIKTGNSVQIERRENRFEKKRDGGEYERPNYATIAQSKAFRNGVLAIIPQDVAQKWKVEMLKLSKSDDITDSVIEQKRSAILQFATKYAIPLLRHEVADLTMDQIAGLSDAAREGKVPMFAQAAKAAGLVAEGTEIQQQALPAPAAETVKPKRAPKQAPATAATDGDPRPEPTAETAAVETTTQQGPTETATIQAEPAPATAPINGAAPRKLQFE